VIFFTYACRSYNHFCACGKQLDARLAALQARQFVGRQEVNKEDWKAVAGWIQVQYTLL